MRSGSGVSGGLATIGADRSKIGTRWQAKRVPRRSRSAREAELLRRAKRRLDTLALYPAPVSTRHVRVVSAPWVFRLPMMRRFHGYDAGPLILVRRPLELTGDDLVTHELTHAWQMQHRPLRMMLSYLWQGYRANEHEIEARWAVWATRGVRT